MENAKEIFDSLIRTTVSEALLIDAIELYASEELRDDDDREDFVEKYSDEAYQPMVRKAVLDVVVAVVAALRIDGDDAFQLVVGMLELEEEDEIIHKMKLAMLRKMTDDAVGDLDDFQEKRFRDRIAHVEKNLS